MIGRPPQRRPVLTEAPGPTRSGRFLGHAAGAGHSLIDASPCNRSTSARAARIGQMIARIREGPIVR